MITVDPTEFVKSTKCGDFWRGMIPVTINSETKKCRASLMNNGEVTVYQVAVIEGSRFVPATIHYTPRKTYLTISYREKFKAPIHDDLWLAFP